MFYGVLQILTYADTGVSTGIGLNPLTRSIQLLLNTQESVLARTLDATAKAFDESKKPAYAAAVLDENSTLYDDLAPILVRLLRDPDLLVFDYRFRPDGSIEQAQLDVDIRTADLVEQDFGWAKRMYDHFLPV